MKNSLLIVILLTFVLAGEAIGNALLYENHDICLLDLGTDGEPEKESKEKESKKKLQIILPQTEQNNAACQAQNIFTHLNISEQASREVVTPPPELS